MAAPVGIGPSLQWVSGEVAAKVATVRRIIPSAKVDVWPPYVRAVESMAAGARQYPAHSHEQEEVLTYVLEGFASYQLEGGPPESMRPGSVRLFTVYDKTAHRISPGKGSSIRWFSLVLALSGGTKGENRLQSALPALSPVQAEGARIRPLVGPGTPVTSSAGLEAKEIQFAERGTAFLRVGRARRGIVYVLAGRGAVDAQPIEVGEAVLIERTSGFALQGTPGLRALVATAPAPG